MPRGGKRPGAGRPVGAATRKTRALADQAAAEGLTPLEVMLRAMREHAEAGRWDESAAVAKDAAPYLHPRLSSVDVRSQNEVTLHNVVADDPLTPEEWEAEVADRVKAH